jgi:hypothetical protein
VLPGDPIFVSGLPRFTLLNRFTARCRVEFPRRTPESREMKDEFLSIGGRLTTTPCGGGVCHSNGYPGP